jgi:hypothetical protein
MSQRSVGLANMLAATGYERFDLRVMQKVESNPNDVDCTNRPHGKDGIPLPSSQQRKHFAPTVYLINSNERDILPQRSNSAMKSRCKYQIT